jgi:hypothetical protein
LGSQVETRSVKESARTSFDLADAMELGMASEATDSFMAPMRKDELENRLLIECAEDAARYVLTTEKSEPLLVAQVSKNTGNINMYIPTGGDPPKCADPAFTMSPANAHQREWVLTCNRCECCEYLPPSRLRCSKAACRRTLGHIRSKCIMTNGCKMMHMEVDVPALRDDGTPEIWCNRKEKELERSPRPSATSSTSSADSSPRSSGPSAGIAMSSPAGRAASAHLAGGKLLLESRQPRWSPKLKSLILDFFGRCDLASTRNFQLQLATLSDQAGRRKPELLHGKVGDNTYVLDYRYPLGMAQAFAIALATKDWC